MTDEKTYVIGVDPGGTTGVSVVGPRGLLASYAVVRSNQAAARTIIELHKHYSRYGRVVVVFETIVGAGARSRDLVYTIEQLGWLSNLCEWLGYEVHRQPPQRRRAYLKDAKKRLDKKYGHDYVVHQMDALAHALAWRRCL